MTTRRGLLAIALAGLSLVGCRGAHDAPARSDADVGGTLVVASIADAEVLLPPLVKDAASRAIGSLLFDHLAEIGPDLSTIGDAGFTPSLADRWSWATDSQSIAFHIEPRARWHDGAPVTANDVRFTFALNKAPDALNAVHLAQIDSVTAPDSATAVFWFARRYPEQFFDAVHHMQIVPEHVLKDVPRAELAASAFARAPIGTGRFRFARWEPGSRLEVVADTANWRGRAKLDRVIWTVTPDPSAVFTRVFSGDADFAEPITNPAILAEAARHPDLAVRTAPGNTYAVLQFNLRDPKSTARPHPLLGDRELRRALSMAVDRERLVASLFDSLAAVARGPMARSQPMADTTIAQLPFDATRAAQLLDSLGWRDERGTGIRSRGGRPLAFTVLVPNTSKPRQQAAILLQEMLRQVGARMEIETVDQPTTIARLMKGDFDAFLNAFGTDPSPSALRDTWGPSGVLNFGKYANAEFNASVDSGVVASDRAAARHHFRRAYETIVADAPAVWLYELRYAAVVHARFQTPGIRAGTWWGAVADWSIPASQRIERDRIGLKTAAR